MPSAVLDVDHREYPCGHGELHPAIADREGLAAENIATGGCVEMLEQHFDAAIPRVDVAGVNERHAHMPGIEPNDAPGDVAFHAHQPPSGGLLELFDGVALVVGGSDGAAGFVE